MSIQLNHTIVWCRDKRRSATFLVEMLGLGPASRFGPFLVVDLSNGVSLDFHDTDGEISSQHYAFLVGEEEFDGIFARIDARNLAYWADPGRTKVGEINRHDGGRGLYFSRIPTVISWRSSPGPMAADADRAGAGGHHAASWRMIPSVWRRPDRRALTPCRIRAR